MKWLFFFNFESHSVVSDPVWPHELYSPWNSPGQNTEWVAIPFFRGSSQPRDWTQVSHIAGRLFTSWATREAPRPPRGWDLPIHRSERKTNKLGKSEFQSLSKPGVLEAEGEYSSNSHWYCNHIFNTEEYFLSKGKFLEVLFLIAHTFCCFG